MGADLYLMSLHEAARKKWEPRFEAAIAERDRHEPGTPEHVRWQKRVHRCYEKMYGEGYFRDPYNNWDVLWQFELSWWGDVLPMLDESGFLSVEDTRIFLTMVEGREEVFQRNVAKLKGHEAQYFAESARELKGFLKRAIERAEPIRCSL